MRAMLTAGLLLLWTLTLLYRLPQWHDDLTIWTAAAQTDADNPRALNNVAHVLHTDYHRDIAAEPYWRALARLPIPAWLPDGDRQPYAIGYVNYSMMLRAYGRSVDGEALAQQAILMDPLLFGR